MPPLTEIDLKTTNNRGALTAIQITDTHLFADITSTLHGHCTHQSLSDVVTYLTNSKMEKPDLVFLTGDVSQDESVESYELAISHLEKLDLPIYWIHGNHDDLEKMKPVFDASKKTVQLKKLATQFWDFISLNTCRRGTDKGYVEDSEIKLFLDKLEKSRKDKKRVAILMHHHPFPVKTPLIDDCILQSSDEFLSALHEYTEIVLIMCGHVHGDYKIHLKQQVLETCPATCFQWIKGTGKIETENKFGFKIFKFSADSYSSETVFI